MAKGFGFWIVIPLGVAVLVGWVVSKFRSDEEAADAAMTAFGTGATTWSKRSPGNQLTDVGPVQRAIRETLSTGQVLYTHARGAAFEVSDIDAQGLVLLLGAGKHRTRFSWECLEGTTGYLAGRDWTKVGGTYDVEGEPQTLDEYLKLHVRRSTSRWIARVLETAGLVEIDTGRPLMIRLSTRSP